MKKKTFSTKQFFLKTSFSTFSTQLKNLSNKSKINKPLEI